MGSPRRWASRFTRYQGAIIRDDHILLVKHKKHATGEEYWVLPGGGREPNETEEACVQREMWEETGLKVTVERLLLDDTANPTGGYYKRSKTYLCRADTGEARPGHEPEEDVAKIYAIAEVGWFKLGSSASWDELL